MARRPKMPRPIESDNTPFELPELRVKDLDIRAGLDEEVIEEESTEDDAKRSIRMNVREVPREPLAARIRVERGE